ncbi:Panacea domain-containing protein [Acinetobacter baumannii]|uniref:Panacea domain-containing protein n=2 Tax=Acinetobacter calcoaceticus/baumannii complex TaxID=909768 RepID=UPI001D1781AC|nr:Panacea domain-containing protein [Acinetobacter baumannii]
MELPAMDNLFLFDEKKLTQAAAFFLFKANGHLPILKLMKLLYISERESFRKFHRPFIGDSLVSMKHGPVLSITYNVMNGAVRHQEFWNEWISDRSNNEVALRDKSMIRSEDDLLELSDNDISLLNNVWQQFGHLSRWDLVDWTHTHCPEWIDPGASSTPIRYDDLFSALGFNQELQKHIIEDMESEVRMNQENKNLCC